MATRSSLQSRIISELHLEDSSLTAAVNLAIDSAVRFYQPTRFWFSEGTLEFTGTLTAQFSLAYVVPDGVQIDTIRVRASSNWDDPLTPKTWAEIQEYDNTIATGTPSCYAVHHQMLRVYPAFNRTMSVEVTWSGNVTLSASPTASCAWTNEAEELIRLHAKVDLCENQLKDYPQADRLRGRESEVLGNMETETIKRITTQRVRGHI